MLLRILIQSVFFPQTPLTSWTLCLTIQLPSQGHPPSQRSPMLPRAASHCHGNQGQRRAPQCPHMSSKLSGTSVTYGRKQRLVTPNFHGNNRCGCLCGEVKQVRVVSGRNFLDLLSLKKWKVFLHIYLNDNWQTKGEMIVTNNICFFLFHTPLPFFIIVQLNLPFDDDMKCGILSVILAFHYCVKSFWLPGLSYKMFFFSFSDSITWFLLQPVSE